MADPMKPIALTHAQLSGLSEAERHLDAALSEVDKLERCGENCDMYRELNRLARDKIDAIRREFGPKPQ